MAAQIERVRRDRDANLKDVVNEAVRRGLRDMTGASRKRKPFRTRSHAMGAPRIDIDNIAEVLAHAEGDAFR